MNERTRSRSAGGIAPFGYRWEQGSLVLDRSEADIRRLVFELFLKHRRKKKVARVVNELGHKTRRGSKFYDITIERLIRDRSAKGEWIANGKTLAVEPIVTTEIWKQANDILGGEAQTKPATHLFTGIAHCGCGGRMFVIANSKNYRCSECRRGILSDDLESIFCSQLEKHLKEERTLEQWRHISHKEKRILIEQICEAIVIGKNEIEIAFAYVPDNGNPETQSRASEGSVKQDNQDSGQKDTVNIPPISEPLLSELEAANFIGVSKMTLSRKRLEGKIKFFKVGHRVLYSKEQHIIPFLRGTWNDHA